MSRTEQLRRAGARDRTEKEYRIRPVQTPRTCHSGELLASSITEYRICPVQTPRTCHSARELLASSIGEDPFELVEQLRKAGAAKAEAAARAHQMQHWRKALLARIASEVDDGNTSEAKLDRLARADDRYKQHIGGEAVAIEAKERAEAEYWRLRDKLEWMRTTVAHLNAMSRLEEPV